MTNGVGILGINPDAFGVWVPDDPGNIAWQDFLDGAADAGFEAVELGPYGYMPTDPSQLADELAARNLTLTCGYLSAAFHEPGGTETGVADVHRIAANTKGAGAEFIMLLADPALEGDGDVLGGARRVPLDPDGWSRMIEGLMEARRVAAEEYGFKVVFHQHVGMAVETPEELERFIEDTGGMIGMCLDTGQYTYPGGDVAAFIRRHPALVTYMQLRDLDREIYAACLADDATFPESCQRGAYCEPGEGIVDFPAVVAAAREAGFDGPAIVERSLLGSTLEEARAAAGRAASAYGSFGFGRRLNA